MTEFIEVQTTAASENEAACIANRLLDLRLAACVQISGPITSHYRWEGKIESATEWICTAKSTQRLFTAIETEIRAFHSYDEPQIVALPLVAGSAGYLNWLRGELREDAGDPSQFPRSSNGRT